MAPLLVQALSQLTGGASLGESYANAKTKLREAVRQDPIDANLTLVIGASALFYFAEKDVNPRVRTYMDSLVYVTTSMSVGHSDILARTETGKLVGSILKTVGPSLSNALLNRPASEPDPNAQVQQAILARLEEILAELKRQREG